MHQQFYKIYIDLDPASNVSEETKDNLNFHIEDLQK
jgi:hypothetical protein